jgi:type IV secretory pathway VirB4 component
MAQHKARSAQSFVPIKEIRSGIVILKDSSMRAVLLCSSINFDLKSEDEQTAVIMQFQNLLNSVDFPLQLFVQSRELDIRPYIALLENQLKEQTTELIRVQTRGYIEFVQKLSEDINIMSKNFFVVIPYNPAIISSAKGGVKGALGGVLGSITKKKVDPEQKVIAFEEHRSQLEQRIGVVTQNLARTGIRAVQLQTEELVELYYKLFNPGDSEKPLALSAIK